MKSKHIITVEDWFNDVDARYYEQKGMSSTLLAYWNTKYPNGFLVVKNLESYLGPLFSYTGVADIPVSLSQALKDFIQNQVGAQGANQILNPNLGAYNGNTGVSGSKIEYVDRYVDRNSKDVPTKTYYTPYFIGFGLFLLFLLFKK